MLNAGTAQIRKRRNTYAGYSISCALVWAGILGAARGLDPGVQRTLRLSCAAWWSGWVSASIARVVYPPPSKLEPAAEKRLGVASLVLIALGLGSVVRLLLTGRRPASGAADS